MKLLVAALKNAVLALMIVVPVSGWAQTEPAQQPRPTKIGIIDVVRLLNESAAGKSLQQQMHGIRNDIQKSFVAKRDEIKNKERELAGLQTILAPEKLEEKKQELRQGVVEANNQLNRSRDTAAQAVKAANQKLEIAINQVAEELAKEQGYALIIRRAATMLSVRSMDVTDEVLKRLDKKLPSIAVSFKNGK